MRTFKLFLWIVALVFTAQADAQEMRRYFVVDDLGSPVIATDENGNEIWTESYDPYGGRLRSEPASVDNQNWFTGSQQESLTGLVDLGNRQFDPIIGRFLGVDPVGSSIGDPFTVNRYVYANNNPYSYVDPNGTSVWTKLFKLIRNGGDVSLTLYGMKQDWDTLNDPSASFGEHLVAGLSLASELLPVSGRDVGDGITWMRGGDRAKAGVPNAGWNPKFWTRSVNSGGRRVYQRDDLFDATPENLARMRKGRPPIGRDGEPVNLHHLTQVEPGSIAEVGGAFHSANTKTLHGLTEAGQSFRYSADGSTTAAEKAFNRWKYSYWKQRAAEF